MLYRRRDLERMALTMISRGHEVAQIKLDEAGAPLLDYPAPNVGNVYAATNCGMIVRKAATAL